MRRRTKIVATMGPATESPEVVRTLIDAGMDVARLNLSHGTVEGHLERLRVIRAAAEAAGRTVGVLADLPGPKVRSGVFPDGGAYLMEGATVRLVTGEAGCDAGVVSVDYPSLLTDLRTGDVVILGDGAITLQVTAITDDAAETVVVSGGRATGRPGVHLPSERLRLFAPTEEDLELLAVMVDAEVDFVAVSFVRSAAEVERVRSAIAERLEPGRRAPMIVAKIETAPAVVDIDAIVEATDAVMVARGDLGIECPLEDVPHVQKHVIRTCVEAGVPVITATQMLESMITSPTPTRAEVSDVANAVFDGTDAVMLSAETAIGHDPALVVTTMGRIAERAEAEADYHGWANRLGRLQRISKVAGHDPITSAMTHACWNAVNDAGAHTIVCCTRTGYTARAMSRFRPGALLLGLSPDEAVRRQLSLSWGVVPMPIDVYGTVDELVWYAVESVVHAGVVEHGQLVAVLAGSPEFAGTSVDVLRLVRVT